ncbi:type VII secretion-associated serine protease mycosin [Prauserella cavernicola]|uniref:type VII secretion-associated serine protease mycosin n=1 Tax=Prauserella cavernicola TaxID=2800127 RepID=UPI0027DB0984|nr:type VII secretion-associated serine protease mycosin [Prauserella cavernicola]
MRSAGPLRRTSALLLAATLGALGPGIVPLPAAAQDTGYAVPPPLAGEPVPSDGGVPDKPYRQETGCVQRDLSQDVVLQNAPWGQQYLRLAEVHQLMQNTTGSIGRFADSGQPVQVAVIDTGVNNHPYFQGRVKPGGDYVANKGQPGMEDCDGHGTEVAGIIAANTPSNLGFKGMAPDVEIISIRQSSQNYEFDEETDGQNQPPPSGDGNGGDNGDGGEGGNEGENGGGSGAGDPQTDPAQDGGGRTQEEAGSAGTLDTLAQAVVNATNRGVDVVNISINNCRPAGPITSGERALQAAVANAVANDIVVVSAAGNTSEACPQNEGDPNNPSTIVTPPWFADDVLSVGAIDQTGGVAEFSVHGPWVSVAAPGTDIISLDPAQGSDRLANMTIENGDPQKIQGTSFAAPYVAGLAALVRAKYPDLNAEQVINRITTTAQHPAAPGGRDNFVGYGVIDPMAALTATVPEEEGMAPASAVALPSDMPPPNDQSSTPMIVALAGSGGALMALLITLFVVHTIRRNRTA